MKQGDHAGTFVRRPEEMVVITSSVNAQMDVEMFHTFLIPSGLMMLTSFIRIIMHLATDKKASLSLTL